MTSIIKVPIWNLDGSSSLRLVEVHKVNSPAMREHPKVTVNVRVAHAEVIRTPMKVFRTRHLQKFSSCKP
jgi:hypothetical protein